MPLGQDQDGAMMDNMHTVEVWHSKDGYRWRKWARNGRMVSESGEAYTRLDDASKAAERENPGVPLSIRDDQPAG